MIRIVMTCFLFWTMQHASLGADAKSDSIISYHFNRGVALFSFAEDSGKAYSEASAEFRKVLSIDSFYAPALAYLGLIALETEDTTKAQTYFTQALTLDSTCAEAYVGKARLYQLRGISNEQQRELQTAIRVSPQNLFARRELVKALLHGDEVSMLDEQRLKEAIPHLSYILSVDSNDWNAHYDLALAFEYFQQWDSALVQYQSALRFRKSTESFSDIRFDVARCLENVGRTEEALQEYQTYLTELQTTQADEQTIWFVERKIKNLQNRLKKKSD